MWRQQQEVLREVMSGASSGPYPAQPVKLERLKYLTRWKLFFKIEIYIDYTLEVLQTKSGLFCMHICLDKDCKKTKKFPLL